MKGLPHCIESNQASKHFRCSWETSSEKSLHRCSAEQGYADVMIHVIPSNCLIDVSENHN